jgi:hypothetical protein
MGIFIYIVSDLYMLVGVLVAFLYILRGGKFYKGIILGCGLCILGSFIAAWTFPSITYSLNRDYFRYFPDINGFPFVVMLSWLPITIVVIVAWLIRKTIINYYPQSRLLRPNNKTKKSKLYIYIGLFYILLGVIMLVLLAIGG